MKKTITVLQNSTPETVDSHEQKTRSLGIIGMDTPDFMDPRNQCHAITRGREISYIRSEIPSTENKTGIISPGKGATA